MNNIFHQYSDANRIQAKRACTSKKRLLEMLSQILADSLPESNAIFDGLLKREKLGATALGNGVAIPHTRADIQNPIIAVLTLSEGIDFDAPDGELVDTFIAIVVPQDNPDSHLNLLAAIARELKDKTFCEVLHNASSDKALFDALLLTTSTLTE